MKKMKSKLRHDKINKAAFPRGKDSDKPRHPPSLAGVFAVDM